MVEKFASELLGLVPQLLVLGVLGGAISWLYSKQQKERELKIASLREFASIHGKFISLRYRYNSFHIEWENSRGKDSHALSSEEMRLERWKNFEEACNLIGEFQGLKPLLVEQFPESTEQINQLHQFYQQWRRRTGGNTPILQNVNGTNEPQYKELTEVYKWAIKCIRNNI
jgi:hypothetical protein